ncbi:16965_t:CDS:2, partial [Racocetra persica]
EHIRKERAKVSSQKGRDKLNAHYKILDDTLSNTSYATENPSKADILLNAALCIEKFREEKIDLHNKIDRVMTLKDKIETLLNEVKTLKDKREYFLNEVNINEVARLDCEIEIRDNELNSLNVRFNAELHNLRYQMGGFR